MVAPAEDPDSLLERVAGGEREALLRLFDRFGGSLLAVALRITGQRPEAEDVVQDALTRAWREAPSFDRTRGSAIAWLIALTRNRAIDLVRARRRRNLHEHDEDRAEPEPTNLTDTPERAIVDAERAAAVRVALDVLRPEQRQVLELAYFSGLSHSEIAAKLDQPLGTVKTRIAQAVRRLREELTRFAPQHRTEG
ncbi:MAG: sigma-70 family RNA polymerase sigma factor [Deltaproteobacteria bacterium]|nr:sigma-70 family RNA polymerase sigma factor [Deltaproteobacteria bacterium]